MADDLSINRISVLNGGITTNERDRRLGVCVNAEEIDIFSNPGYIQANTVFSADSTQANVIGDASGNAISSITHTGTTATLTTSQNHCLVTNAVVVITGCIPTAYNGTFTITVTGATTFTYTMLSDPGSNATVDSSMLRVPIGGMYDYATDGTRLYALSEFEYSSPNGYRQIFVLNPANSDSLSVPWRHLFMSSAQLSDLSGGDAMLFHQQDESGTIKQYLYNTGTVTGSGALLYRLGDLIAGYPYSLTNSSTDVNTTSMLMTGFIQYPYGTTVHRPRISIDNEIFFGHGQFIAKVDDVGVFTEKAFTLPAHWYCVDFVESAGSMMILAQSPAFPGESRVFLWDTVRETQYDDVITIPSGGGLAIANQNETIRIFTVQDSILRIYELSNRVPVLSFLLNNVQDYEVGDNSIGTDAIYAPIFKQGMFTKDGILYFGLWKTDKSGLYAIGQVEPGREYSLILAHRFIPSTVSSYASHRIIAATNIGPNMFVSFHNGSNYMNSKLKANDSPNRSSDAVYESVYLDADAPESNKSWEKIVVMSRAMPASTSVSVDGRTDSASSYDSNSLFSLSSTNDQVVSGNTADRFWERQWTSLIGRMLQVRLRFTSSTTNTPQIYSFSVLSRNHEIL